jgi:hypothetical protein
MSLARRGRNQGGYTVTAPWDTIHEYNAISVGSPRTLPPVTHRGEAIQELVPVVNSDIPHRIDILEERLQVIHFGFCLVEGHCMLHTVRFVISYNYYFSSAVELTCMLICHI